jgi:hypothetical protein
MKRTYNVKWNGQLIGTVRLTAKRWSEYSIVKSLSCMVVHTQDNISFLPGFGPLNKVITLE